MASARFSLTPVLVALAIVTGVTLAYQNTFTVPFLFDDNSLIRDNPSIRSVWTSLAPAPGVLKVSGRPLVNFTLALSYALSGTSVWGYQLLNLLIHAAAGRDRDGWIARNGLRCGAGRFP